MSKSVYSIVLTDEVVAAIDLMALRLGTNRSKLIDSILAEQVSVVTPERRIKDILDNILGLMDDSFIRDTASAGSALAMRSSIKYKYKPTVRYSVELLRVPEGERIGSLKISFRTRSEAFVTMLGGFYDMWIGAEKALCSREIAYSAEGDRLVRSIYFPEGESSISSERLGALIGEYIKAFDSALKQYFALTDDARAAENAVRLIYTDAARRGINRI